MESTTHLRQLTCPWRALRDPFVIAVVTSYRWFKEHQLEARRGQIPEALARGLEIYDATLNAVRNHDAKLEHARVDEENKKRADEAAQNAGGHGWRPIGGPRRPMMSRRRR